MNSVETLGKARAMERRATAGYATRAGGRSGVVSERRSARRPRSSRFPSWSEQKTRAAIHHPGWLGSQFCECAGSANCTCKLACCASYTRSPITSPKRRPTPYPQAPRRRTGRQQGCDQGQGREEDGLGVACGLGTGSLALLYTPGWAADEIPGAERDRTVTLPDHRAHLGDDPHHQRRVAASRLDRLGREGLLVGRQAG